MSASRPDFQAKEFIYVTYKLVNHQLLKISMMGASSITKNVQLSSVVVSSMH